MYSGDYTGRRHSPLTQVTPANVNRLAAQWAFQADNMVPGRGFEGTPLMLDGVLYVTGNNNTAWAIDVRTGRQLWRYRRNLPPGLTYGSANASNRGFAVLGDLLFMGTLDAHLIALDRRTGKPVWDATVADFKVGYAITQAPLIVKDKVIIGIAGGDIPTRGFVDAYDPKTGVRAWRFYTIPARGEPGSETWSDADRAAARRRRHLADRQLRSRAQPALLGRRQSESRLLRRGPQGRQPLHRVARSRSTPTPASCAGTSSSRRTTCTTGTPITFRCSPT